jgi:Mrp family chromosome partitioning ATPase
LEAALPLEDSQNTAAISIDSAILQARGYLPEPSHQHQLLEQYRRIKRPLIDRAFSSRQVDSRPDARVIVVVSALPGDGKTFTSINLALSLARERDMSVVLVDADMLRPRLSEVLGLRKASGLMDALTDRELLVQSFVSQTSVNNLSFLPAGTVNAQAEELLASSRMRQITSELLADVPRRIILIDSPPLLSTSEGRALVKVAGQIVLVVRAGQTPSRLVKEAVTMFGEESLGGIILNEAQLTLSESFYGYGHYGLYSTQGAGDRTPPAA